MKVSSKQVTDAYVDAVERCNKKILEASITYKDQPDDMKAYYIKKVIDRWFLKGGIV